jgi:hypothetical protein
MIKKVSLGVVVGIGAVWVLATFVLGLWGKTAAADRLTADLEPAFSNAAVSQQDAAAVAAFTDELETKTIPFLAVQLHAKPQDVTELLASKYPAVGRVLSAKDNSGSAFEDGKPYLNHASGYLNSVTADLRTDQDDFSQASDIPASYLPTKAVAWLFLLLGLATLVLGGLLRAKPEVGARLAAGVAALGLVVIAVTFGLHVPGKTQALDDVTDTFRPVFTSDGPLSIAEGQAYLDTVRAADVELETKVIPALPALLKLSPEAVVSALSKNSPIVAGAMLKKDAANPKVSVLGGILDRFDALAATVNANVEDFRSTDEIPGLGMPASSVAVLLVGPAVLLLLAAVGLGAPRPARGDRRAPSARLVGEMTG